MCTNVKGKINENPVQYGRSCRMLKLGSQLRCQLYWYNYLLSIGNCVKLISLIKERKYRHVTSSRCVAWYVYTTCLLHYSRHGILMPGWHGFSETTEDLLPCGKLDEMVVFRYSTILLFLPPLSSERCGNSPHNLESPNPVHTTPFASTFIFCPLHNVKKIC